MKLGFYNQLYCFKSWGVWAASLVARPSGLWRSGKAVAKDMQGPVVKAVCIAVLESSMDRQTSIITYGIILGF